MELATRYTTPEMGNIIDIQTFCGRQLLVKEKTRRIINLVYDSLAVFCLDICRGTDVTSRKALGLERRTVRPAHFNWLTDNAHIGSASFSLWTARRAAWWSMAIHLQTSYTTNSQSTRLQTDSKHQCHSVLFNYILRIKFGPKVGSRCRYPTFKKIWGTACWSLKCFPLRPTPDYSNKLAD